MVEIVYFKNIQMQIMEQVGIKIILNLEIVEGVEVQKNIGLGKKMQTNGLN